MNLRISQRSNNNGINRRDFIKRNLNRAYKKVVANKGASGVDGVTVEELGDYIRKNKDAIVTSIRNRTYMPKPVR